MDLKLKRLVRTTNSEQYALFDLDQVDGEGQPLTIGKLDLHYTNEGMYGTILLWDDASQSLQADDRRHFIRALLDEISQPMGVPNEFVVEFFTPSLDSYELFHNIDVQEEEAVTTDTDDQGPMGSAAEAPAADETVDDSTIAL